ncbi:MAG: hypothetical protein KAI59_06540 [Planctomycetes bacterium]|nr:hypothetical protein [Planctomycetota bacterium]MCK5473674.1 hypothetical protein [Planctomycetota bacterium]
MKSLKWRNFVGCIIFCLALGVWIGYALTIFCGFPKDVLMIFSLAMSISCIFLFDFMSKISKGVLTILLLFVFFFLIPLHSLSLSASFENLTNYKLSIICIDPQKNTVTKKTILPKEARRVGVFRGDNVESKKFVFLATDNKGNIYLNETFKGSELTKNNIISIYDSK